MKEIVSTGRPPILVRNVIGSVVLQRSDAESLKVVALDLNGYRRKELPGGGGGRIRIELLPDCFYYVIRKRFSKAESKPSPRQESEFRTWTSSDGRFTVEAKLIKAVRGVIYLQRKDDGRQIEVPIGSISQKDREFIQSADG